MPKAKYIMTIEGLESQPIAIEITSFGWTPSQSLSGAPIYALPDQRDIQRSGTGPEPIESIRFSFEAFDMKNSSDSPGSLYRGPVKGRTK